jgi:hypothetical protein
MPKRMFEQVRGLSVDLERILIIELLQGEQLIGHLAHCITNGYEIRRKCAPNRPRSFVPAQESQTTPTCSGSPHQPCHFRATNPGQPRSTQTLWDTPSPQVNPNPPAPTSDSQAEYAGSIPVIGSSSFTRVDGLFRLSGQPRPALAAGFVPLGLLRAFPVRLHHRRQLFGDPTVSFTGGALVDQRGPHVVVAHASHEVPRRHAGLRRPDVSRVPQIVEVHSRHAEPGDQRRPLDPLGEVRASNRTAGQFAREPQ